MKFDSEKRKCLFVQVRPEAWGDGLENVRMLRGWKRSNLESSVYHVAHPQVSDAFGALLVYEGLVDSVLTPMLASHREDVLDDIWELSERIRNVRFDTAIFSRCFGVPKHVLVLAFPAKEILATYCTHDHWGHLSKEPPYFARTMGEESIAMTLEESVAPALRHLSDRSSVVALFPFSTRPYSTVHEHVWGTMAEMILDRGHEVMLLGKTFPNWLSMGNKLDYWDSLRDGIRRTFDGLPVINVMEWSAPKQSILLKRCDFAVVTMTGAAMLPILYDVPCLALEGGDNDTSAALIRMYGRKIVSHRASCERYPCSQRGMLALCQYSGRAGCLSSELFDEQSFEKALASCEEAFCAGSGNLQPL